MKICNSSTRRQYGFCLLYFFLITLGYASAFLPSCATHSYLLSSVSLLQQNEPSFVTHPYLLPSVSIGQMKRHCFAVVRRRQRKLYSVRGDEKESLSSVSPTVQSTQGKKNQRIISRVEQFARLPVWPVWNGALFFIVGKLFGFEAAAKLEDKFGGRVCPNFFQSEKTSPFIMLVHHRHSFAPWDPLRYIQRSFFPEGFPAHPHRGFVTVTYILKGGFKHRDSLGIQQLYGAEKRHDGKHTQWLSTGAGILHEEMFDTQADDNGILPPFLQPSSQELYQLWLNVPSQCKLVKPNSVLLGGDSETPIITTDKTETIVIAGEHGGKQSLAPTVSDVVILHVKMEPDAVWEHKNFSDNFQTMIMYVRTGSVVVDKTKVSTHHTAYFSSHGNNLIVDTTSDEGADFLLLAGQPLNEPVAAEGSMVMNYPNEINQAYADYQNLKMGKPWDQKLTDDEWQMHIKEFPSIYK